MPGRTTHSTRVAIIGGGPAGLTAARELAGSGEVLVLERESDLGGIPRHANHWGYGVRDLRRVMTGPAYARQLAREALSAGATAWTSAMVTGIDGRSLEVTSPRGVVTVEADAVVLATGARERPRAARRIPGDRPRGVYTTGELQNRVHLHHREIGKRIVVVGAELVSWSAVLTLRHAGARAVLMTSSRPAPETYAAVALAGRVAFGVPVATDTTVERVIGKGQVEGVEVLDHLSGRRRVVACDGVVFTADWIPDHELAVDLGLELEPASLAPRVDTALRTGQPGIFAAGNLLHPVDTADNAALDGRHVARSVERWLAGATEETPGVGLLVEEPLRWMAPGLLRPGDPAPTRGRYLAWVNEYRRFPTVVARQAGRVVGRVRTPWPAAPGRVFRIPASVLEGVDRRGEEVRISLG
ncbi:FAD-dependent oxidoreductase [Brooklawnia cerclae]|uniref:Thioredoxin reductase n=1 Tax=Brooklawnia cerclae TaxID=349934 RepID=A0ABX0SLG7_9ACTN|nr:NAD(P)/FAD-dependent oxidoreductase [Brooklawnia cerclae]NIH57577.1 thioredoxin reductase [Brooklawnia cerclae]